jgi:RHS repeat-associated protein
VTLYTYEGWNVVAEKTTIKETATTTRYTWGEDLSGSLQGAGGIGGLLRSSIVEAKPNGTRQTEHEHTFSYDSNGNIILLTGPKAQETARYSYDAFGKTLTATGPAAQTNRYQFSTKPVEEESGLVYYGYRWYDPVTGRWPSRDPIEEGGGVNLYGMVGNGGVNVVDRLGLYTVVDCLNDCNDRYLEALKKCVVSELVALGVCGIIALIPGAQGAALALANASLHAFELCVAAVSVSASVCMASCSAIPFYNNDPYYF